MSSALRDIGSGGSKAASHGPTVLNRACQECQRRKIKCITPTQEDLDNGRRKCSRCSKLGLHCAFLPPAIRKQRRRNETRIKELERKLEEIHQAVSDGGTKDAISQPVHPQSDHNKEVERGTQPHTFEGSQSQGLTPATNDTLPETAVSETSNNALKDDLAGGILSHTLAKELYKSFSNNLAPLYPLVLAPDSSIWQDVRQERPALFQAAVAAASSGVDPGLSRTLFHNAGKVLAEKVVLDGEKSLDLVQALLILASWHHPPTRFQDLKFSQYAHMAATMVMDLQSSNDGRYQVPFPKESLSAPSEHLVEICRTYLACYFLCSSMALSFRRPTMLRHGPWIEDCMKVLETQSFVHPSDSRLVAWTKLQRIAEKSLAVIGLDQKSSIDLSDARTRFIVKGCLEQVTSWRHMISKDVMIEPMEMHYEMILICLHEPALHAGHNVADFRPPYTIRSLPLSKKECLQSSTMETANGMAQCISSAQTLIRTFLSLTDSVLLSIPVVVYTRMTYAVVILLKSYISTRGSSVNKEVNSVYGNEPFNPAELLFQLLDKLDSAAGQARLPVPAAFYRALSRVTDWFLEHFERRPAHSNEGPETLIEPLMHISLESTQGSYGNVVKHRVSHGLAVPENTANSNTSIGRTSLSATPSSWQDVGCMDDFGLTAFDGRSFPEFPNVFMDFGFDHSSIEGALDAQRAW